MVICLITEKEKILFKIIFQKNNNNKQIYSSKYKTNKIVNTKAWTKETKNSKTISKNCHFLKIAKIKWPAVKLAPNRNPKVIGRINFLINSINTINLIRKIGVPIGVKWTILFFKK